MMRHTLLHKTGQCHNASRNELAVVCSASSRHQNHPQGTRDRHRSDVYLVEFEKGTAFTRENSVRRIFEGREQYVIDNSKYALSEALVSEPFKAEKPERCRRISDPVFVLGYYMPIYNNYGHFLVDQLPSMNFQDEIWEAGYRTILVVGVQSKALRSRIKTLLLQCLHHEFVVEFVPFMQMDLERASFLHGLSRHPGWKNPLIENFFGQLRVPAAPTQLLFVSRQDASDRMLENEDELYSKLAPLGYRKVLGSELGVEEAIKIFSGAKIVVGVCGASMANIVFAQPKTSVINILSNAMDGYWYFDLAATMKLDYFDYRGPVNIDCKKSRQGPGRSTDSFVVDVDDFTRRLRDLERSIGLSESLK